MNSMIDRLLESERELKLKVEALKGEVDALKRLLRQTVADLQKARNHAVRLQDEMEARRG